MKVKLKIESYFWNKESNNLIDYDALEECFQSIIIAGSSGKLVRSGKNVSFFPSHLEKVYLNKLWIKIFEFKMTKENVLLSSISPGEKPYLSIKHTFNNKSSSNSMCTGLKLKEGDIIKFGKLSVTCREIFIHSIGESALSKMKEKTLGENYFEGVNEDIELQISQEKSKLILSQNQPKLPKSCLCRFCLCEDSEENNPLITPCKCSGSMKYIHIDCLKNWLKSKITTKVMTSMISYTYKQFSCELCLGLIPSKFKFKSKQYDLLDMKIPSDCTYIIFEQVIKDEQLKVFYLLMFNGRKALKIGRSNDSDFRLSDISISRHHADLFETPHGIYLDDNKSKFGSLYLLEHKLSIIYGKGVGIQIGKHFFMIKMNRSLWSTICCYK